MGPGCGLGREVSQASILTGPSGVGEWKEHRREKVTGKEGKEKGESKTGKERAKGREKVGVGGEEERRKGEKGQ